LLGLVERLGSYHGGELLRHFLLTLTGCVDVKVLSVFIDESGDFGEYEPHSPYYIVTLIFHDQSIDINENINHLNQRMCNSGLPEYTIHTGPLIRRENEYFNLPMIERKRIFNILYNFLRTIDVSYKSIVVDKKELARDLDLVVRISKNLSRFLNDNLETFIKYDRIIIYYDEGQRELRNIIVSIFNSILNNLEYKKPDPAYYKLCQAADMLCTLELLDEKVKNKSLTKSELAFFSSAKALNKSYLKAIHKKRFDSKE